MKLTDILYPGDKVDVKVKQQVEGKVTALQLQSRVADEISDFELDISMPTLEGKMILLQAGTICEFVFYTKKGMYKCVGVVNKRFKNDKFYLLTVLVKTEPVKFQRREFFRVDYLTEVSYHVIDKETAKLPTTEKVYEAVCVHSRTNAAHKGMSQDVSGGGVRFTSAEQFEIGSYLFFQIRLTNEKFDETFHLVSEVISSDKHASLANTYSNRVKFLYKDLKDREKIVRFVFEEDRRLRKKEIGE